MIPSWPLPAQASPALDRIMHHDTGHFTGYLHGTISQAAGAFAAIPRPPPTP